MSHIQLIHGDCLELMRGLPDGSIDAVICDPPYGMNYNTNSTPFTAYGHGTPSTRNYPKVEGDNKPFDPSPWLSFPRVVLFGANHFAARLPVGTTLVWIKKHDAALGTFLSDAEIAWMKGGHGIYCRRDTSMLNERRTRVHPTQKPVSLMRWVLKKAGVKAGMTVLDPYTGSGSTALACLQMGINFIGYEIDETHFNAAKARIEAAPQQQVMEFATT